MQSSGGILHSKNETVEYAVVGAGISGLYVAWRLARAGKRSVHLYEATERVGGRILSPEVPGMLSRAELGAMRITNRQVLVTNLVNELGLPSQPFEYDLCFRHLRGSHLRPEDTPPYRLGVEEREKGLDELVQHAIRSALLELLDHTEGTHLGSAGRKLKLLRAGTYQLHKLTADEWGLLKIHGKIRGMHLYDMGFWNLLAHYLSGEAFLFVRDALGYDSVLANWNAGEAIPWFLRDFGAKEYRTLTRGMGDLPNTLVADFLGEPCDGYFHDEHLLTSITTDHTDRSLLVLHFEAQAEPVKAKHVVLALPKKPLKTIFSRDQLREGELGDTSGIEQLCDALDSVMAHPLFKLFVGYERAWWNDPRALGRSSGRITTDMPIRQVYYFGGPTENETSNGLVMASYSDARYVDYWMPFQRRDLDPPFYDRDWFNRLTPEEQESVEKLLEDHGATERMVIEAVGQLERLHPELGSTTSIRRPCMALATAWSLDDDVFGPLFGGGWHTWKARTMPWKVRKTLTQPFHDVHMYICGEAYSCEQGWIEGALRSAELVLRKLGIPRPEWVEDAEYTYNDYFRGYEDYVETP